ncbi:hypothetical protein M404DRAFT_120136 [Pisolithus tinctorius Marx 270]|uniref:Uncharacterized protein n=1 Tax=Pisolithus tinctorius Marx 270 TaxID=870435 RepID=A0A0C3PKB1_PISTI|nr:hypothetical protein M404DRAFT_120136 [Pisolithus tinctorius Marx 270]
MIEVNSSWSHEDVTTQLRSWFPNVFQYFDSHREKANMMSQTQPDWQLLVPANGKLELSTAVRPNGVVLARFKGRQKSGIADSNLWFGMWLKHYNFGRLNFLDSHSKSCPQSYFRQVEDGIGCSGN